MWSIGYALARAVPRALVLVAPGTYQERANPGRGANLIGANLPGLSLVADRAAGGSGQNTIINAGGLANGVVVQADGATVSGFTVEHAQLEGILVEPPPGTWPSHPADAPAEITGVKIEGNQVQDNDLAFDLSAPNPLAACRGHQPISMTVARASIFSRRATRWRSAIGNRVDDNIGGILVSDGGLPGATGGPTSVGPAAHDTIAFNTSSHNAIACGITVPGHNPRAIATSGPASGEPRPTLAGVYDNLIMHNVSEDNGGAGLLDAAPYPGTGAYANTFTDNVVSGNDQGGFQLHSHAPMQDVNDLHVVGNDFAANNLLGDADSGDLVTTAIILFSATNPVTGTVVKGNSIARDTIGIWRTANVPVRGLRTNRFDAVGVDEFTQ